MQCICHFSLSTLSLSFVYYSAFCGSQRHLQICKLCPVHAKINHCDIHEEKQRTWLNLSLQFFVPHYLANFISVLLQPLYSISVLMMILCSASLSPAFGSTCSPRSPLIILCYFMKDQYQHFTRELQFCSDPAQDYILIGNLGLLTVGGE